MKKAILFALAVFTTALAFSQVQTMTNPNGRVLDTVVTAVPEGPTVFVPGFAQTVAPVIVITKISGSVAGKLYLRGGNSATVFAKNPIDSITMLDESTILRFKETNPGYPYYKVEISLAGTGQASYSATLYARKPK